MDLRKLVVANATKYLGITCKGDPKHKELIDYYNSHVTPLPRGYALSYTDSYCAAACTSWFWMSDLQHLIFSECGVNEMIAGSQKMGIWVEDDNFVPQTGDLVTFSWTQTEGENVGPAKHVALVQQVENGVIYLINPNCEGGQTKVTSIQIGDISIRGFITPKY